MIISLKKFHVLLGSILILCIHLPFVFAKARPDMKLVSANTTARIGDLSNTERPDSRNHSFLYDSLQLNDLGLSKQAFEYALKGFDLLRLQGKLFNNDLLTIVDFSLPSGKKRLFVFDVKEMKLLFNTYVAHGRNSGREFAKEFSNEPESYKSSLGFYVTKDTYNGAHGYSLHLEGEEKGINDNAFSRAIVMHSASYANESVVKSQGFLGRSLGCPALPEKLHKPIIDKIKNGSCLFMYSPNQKYLSRSKLLKTA